MGFGILFLGYILSLNVTTYCMLTDLIMALILLLAANKLAAVSRDFKVVRIMLIPFAVLSLFELVVKLLEFLKVISAENSTGVAAMMETTLIIRYLFMALITFFIMHGIARLAKELDIPKLLRYSRIMKYANAVIYTGFALFTVAPTAENDTAAAVIALMIFSLFIIAGLLSLLVIYSAYMQICMPEDLEFREKPSKFAFVNKFREHEAEKQKEYADYKLEKLKKKAAKKKRKKK